MIHLEAAEERKIGEKDSHRHYCVLNEVYPEVGVSTPSALMTELRAHVKVADPRWGQHAWQWQWQQGRLTCITFRELGLAALVNSAYRRAGRLYTGSTMHPPPAE